jgi:hypothetical protein
MRPLLYRVFKVRLGSAVIACLPLLIVLVWYAWSAYATFDRYRRASGSKIVLDAQLFQLHLHDELVRDLRRLSLPDRPADSRLPTLALSLTRESLDALGSEPGSEGEDSYVDGYLQKDGRVHEVRVRYRGQRYWYWLYPQKSYKIRLKSGELVDNARTFHLINDVTPFGLEEQLILDLARAHGTLTPEYRPVWVRLNNSDMGVYRFEAQPDEGLLRRNERMPGSMYSGSSESVDQARGVGSLFYDRSAWRKVAWATEQAKEDFSELERLLGKIRDSSSLAFAEYAESELDLDKFALFDALDVVFGGNQHDYSDNHKLYFDPYRGRFEPIAWSFRGFEHEERFNRVENPLLLRLKFVPGYLARRNRAVYRLLTGEASVSAIRARANQLFAELGPDLQADPYWDAYKLLPPISTFHRRMVRPMSTGQWALAASAEIAGFERRSAYLLEELERADLEVGWTRGSDVALEKVSTFDFSAGGEGAYDWRKLLVQGGCAGSLAIWADRDRDGHFDRTRDALVASGELDRDLEIGARLLPGVELVARTDPTPSRGKVVTKPALRRYRYFVVSQCAPERATLVFENLITGLGYRKQLTLANPSHEPADDAASRADEVPRFVASDQSPHLWYFPSPAAPHDVVLGPGDVTVDATRVFGPGERVRVLAGTRVLLAPGASLVFHGRVSTEGTALAPVVFERANPDWPFGGIALQGGGTAGSRLLYTKIHGGSRARHGAIDYPGMLNVHDTSSISLESVEVGDCVQCDDLLHVAYVSNFELQDARLERAQTDALDLEFSSAEVQALRVDGAGDDCLDLMGTTLRLSDSVLAGCVNNGISAGERTKLTAHGAIVAGARTAVLAKNASEARLLRSLIYDCHTALKTGRKENHYQGQSSIGGSSLSVEHCANLTSPAPGTTIDVRLVQAVRRSGSGLEHLFALLDGDERASSGAIGRLQEELARP